MARLCGFILFLMIAMVIVMEIMMVIVIRGFTGLRLFEFTQISEFFSFQCQTLSDISDFLSVCPFDQI